MVNKTGTKTAINNIHVLTSIEGTFFFLKSIRENHDQAPILGRLHLQPAGNFCNTK